MELLNNGWDDLETGEFPAPGVSKRKSQWLPVESAMKGSSVVRWLSSHLPMQRIRVQSLLREDPPCHGAANPLRQLLKPAHLGPVCQSKGRPVLHSWSVAPGPPQLEKVRVQQ